MKTNTQNVLSGKNNHRLDNSTPKRQEDTAAWNETEKTLNPSKVSVPSQPSVVNAKEWVDNGSRL